jgi:GT2 family glycosyltransferase
MSHLPPRFPGVKFITNDDNAGFAKACNQGLAASSGELILFLNPDTIVPEDCFNKCINFFKTTKDAGALGVKMIDGSGHFLKESKRSFPSPMTSLYKLFGLSRLFPRSRTLSKYHLGYIEENENNEIDVLAGAFMLIKKEVLEKVGGFDEIFFMYGEDVDLSYRIQKAGYKNYYFAESTIIHFKGESTKKGSMNYVRLFYNAMSIFVRKHYGGSRAGVFNFLIHIAIWFRAALTAVGSFIRRLGLPLIDAGIILVSFWIMKNIWGSYVRPEIQYDYQLLWIAFPVYTVFYLITAYYAGLYDKWYKRSELVSASFISIVVLLAGYALLPEQYRFSRAIVLFGALLAFVLISILRGILIKTEVIGNNNEKNDRDNTIIIASPEEYTQVMQILKEANLHQRVLGRVAVEDNDLSSIGFYKNLASLTSSLPVKEVIFCNGNLSFSGIITEIGKLPAGVNAKIHSTGSSSIVGSNSKDSLGEAVSKENGFNLANPRNRRLKRLIDVSVALMALVTFPIQLFIIKKPFSFLKNCFHVLLAKKTWIGYSTGEKNIPFLRKAIITCNGIPVSATQKLPAESLQMMDYWYARDYEPVTDIKLIWRKYRQLGD